MYCLVIFNPKEHRWHFFTNEVWLTRNEAEAYARQNNFKKDVQWKVLWYDKKYKINYSPKHPSLNNDSKL
jgi:hypothetical protein